MSNDAAPIIRHLVIAGGGTFFYNAYGILRETSKRGVWDWKNIRTIYGTSAGAILGYMLAMNFDWDTLDKYIIDRPWEKVFDINMNTLLNSYQNCGILGIQIIRDICEPPLLAKNMSLNTTLLEFYETTGIEVHSFTTEFNDFCLIDVSHKTHPDWKVAEAIYSSCCLPLLFSPFRKENKIYMDGGFFSNYPLRYCVENTSAPLTEIFGIQNKTDWTQVKYIKENASLFDYGVHIILAMLYKLRHVDIYNGFDMPYEITVVDQAKNSIIHEIYKCTSSASAREALILEGQRLCEDFVFPLPLLLPKEKEGEPGDPSQEPFS